MIEIAKKIPNPGLLEQWLVQNLRAQLTPDVSNYAKGRLRAWLRIEPPLSPTRPFQPGLPVNDAVWNRLAELIEWPFDYCLVTYSGDDKGVGIGAHRDASYADYEAYSIHVSGECRFAYWQDKKTFGYSRDTNTVPSTGPPSDQILLQPGDVTRFNCKNLHSATPGAKRWNLNFWRKKPVR